MKIKFGSLKTRLTISLMLMVLLPTITIGWMAYKAMAETITSERIRAVGQVANSKHDQLVMVLTRANTRAEQFLSDLNKQCSGAAAMLNPACATRLIRTYLTTEGAIGATLRQKGSDSLTIGTSATRNEEPVRFQPGQLAKFAGTGPDNNRSYFVSVAEKSVGSKLEITYPSSVLEPVFNPPPAELGLSGETFLADGEGYFVTKPRYASTQGHKHPISAYPMQSCLSGQSGEVLDLDYRDASIIHGFHFIPELGSACIMAHITQEEAFAPLKLLQQKIMIAILLFGTILIIMAVYLARNIVKPITKLTKVTRSIATGDYKAQADTAGSDEISELATSFNFMTERLHDSHDDLHRLLNSMAEGVYGVDTDGNCTFVNQSFLRMLGYQNDNEVLGKIMHELIHHSHADGSPHPVSECKIYRAYQANQTVNVDDEVFWRKDGVAIPVEYWSHPVITAGVVTGSIVTFVDITKRKLADDMLRVAAITFETHEGIAITDVHANIIRVNRAFEKITGYSQKEVLGQNPRVRGSGRHDKAFYAAMWQQLLNNGSWTGEIWNKRKNGQIYPEWLTITSVKNGQGETTEYVAIFSDITERKQAEEKLHKYNEELEAINRQLEETQSHLLQSEKMASIGQLAAGVAHEINNPIGYVYSNLGTLEQYVQDTFGMLDLYEQAESAITDTEVLAKLKASKNKLDIAFLKQDLRALMDESKDGITRVKKIVQNLKDFSHVDVSDEWHFTDLHQGLDSTLNIVNNEIKYKADVLKEYGTLPEVECLSSQINQVFMNLLVNASHAIEERGTITIRTGQQGDEVWVEVADTGKGIAPEHLKKIFDPFFTTKPIGKGTGLGLSLSYGILQKHNGRIEVQSEVGKGTTFRVWLPVKHTDSPPPDPNGSSALLPGAQDFSI